MRGKWIGLMIVCGIASKAAAQPGNPAMVPDRQWIPLPGSEATAYTLPVPAAATIPDLHKYLKARKVNDAVGMKRMEEAKAITLIPERVGLLVIERHDFTPREAPRFTTGEEVARESLLRALTPPREYPPNVLEVRFKAGPLKDESAFVPEDAVAHLVPYAAPVPKPVPPDPKPPAPADRAATHLKMGRALEKAGKRTGAIENYRKAVADAPGSMAAREAAARLKAIGTP